jgi:hypothetical protein
MTVTVIMIRRWPARRPQLTKHRIQAGLGYELLYPPTAANRPRWPAAD